MGGFFYFSIYYCSFAKKIVMNIRKFAGIDIGSNGVRLLIANILEEEGKTPIFSKGSLVRVPIRLGADVFEQGRISAENASRLSDTMQAYHLLMKVQGVEAYRACATSAMREATNGTEIVREIAQHTGVQIEIIGGSEEAAIIANTDLHTLVESDKNYLYIDVGGAQGVDTHPYQRTQNNRGHRLWRQYQQDIQGLRQAQGQPSFAAFLGGLPQGNQLTELRGAYP